MRKAHAVHSLLAATSLGVGVVLGATTLSLAGTDQAPLPRCERTPGVADQGDNVVVRGQRWESDSTVTIAFDGEDAAENGDDSTVTGETTPTSVEDQGDDLTSTTGEQPDDSSLSTVVTRDVSSRGRFRAKLTIPDDAVRGTHSINIDGTDADGIEVSCALVIGVLEQTSNPSDTTQTTGEGGTQPTTGTTEGSAPSTGSTTTSTAP